MSLLDRLPASAILLYSVVAAFILIYAPFFVVAYGRIQAGYDTSAPRALFDKLPPYAQRATWAHQNSFETFTPFAAAAIMAYVTGVDSPIASIAAIAHVIGRLLYSPFYILNQPILRSMMFGLGSAGTITLFVLSLLKVS